MLHTLKSLALANGETLDYYSLPALEAAGVGPVSRLPVSIRLVLESVLRNCDGKKVTIDHVRQLANWQPQGERVDEIPFIVARVVLQDFTGVPLLADLAAMRSAVEALGRDPALIEPLVPVDLVVDHSVQVDVFGRPDALQRNMEFEFARNGERYRFMKWGMQAFDTFKVVPPGIGIVHQVNLEYLFRGVQIRDGVAFPDTLVGTDSHTTMINAVGAVGWGVGGIEAEAGMLGQPVYFLTPDVIGVELKGRLRDGVTATDLVLTVTELLRREKVVGKFVEFFGDGTASLTVPDRATIANMAPEYGATMGFFPVDEQTIAYLRGTGRLDSEIEAFEAYFRTQQLFGIPKAGDIDYTRTLTLDLAGIVPSLAGPKRPQDRIALPAMRETFETLFSTPVGDNGFGKPAAELARRYPVGQESSCSTVDGQQFDHTGSARNVVEMADNRPSPDRIDDRHDSGIDLGHGDVLIAAITSCTNTSNPGVLLAAGLLARKAVAHGLRVKPHIKTSLAPGSRVVTEYLEKTGLLEPLAQLGFALAGYGCTTCIGNSGDLTPELNAAIAENDVIAAAVLSGNRNFEARIHPNIRANYLASPPLVVAFALAGRVDIDLESEPLGIGNEGEPVYLRDVWPAADEIAALLPTALDPAVFRRLYADFTKDLELWNAIPAPSGQVYSWPASTYIARPPFFDGFAMQPGTVSDIHGARALLVLGDSVTTDHISPAGSFGEKTPAGQYLIAHGVPRADFNSYGSRRGNHDIMIRGTFANVRIRNLMLPAKADGSRTEGGYTLLDGAQATVFDAAQAHLAAGTPTVVFAGDEYGTGSSRDWAAKGTQLLGVKAVIARSFERIHRSNLVGMGVLPLQFSGNDSAATLQLVGDETFDIVGIDGGLKPQQDLTLRITGTDGKARDIAVRCRIDTPIEVDYYRHGGILPYVLRELLVGTR
ncbi:aconitate hydratase AcnA [Jeongeupia sp. USM3]|uniref:aconitate hydratase AcnA n=1 Tax=Jeongeupia sp. USM3 TaxID=1906741 RepID=UPI00089E068E|nr:aconitate hydratase AcnA [Jeongeupia sp. USM3]AOX99425.1 aconitate hydratase 1 [Jeongeupia sp. USM3]